MADHKQKKRVYKGRHVGYYTSTEEYELLKSKAADRCISMSELIREIVNNSITDVRNTEEDKYANETLYTIKEVAEYMKSSERSVRNMINKGKIKAYRIGKQFRISSVDLDEYMSNPYREDEILFDENGERLYTPQEAARLLMYTVKTIYKDLDEGKLHNVGIGRQKRIRESELMQVLRSQRAF